MHVCGCSLSGTRACLTCSNGLVANAVPLYPMPATNWPGEQQSEYVVPIIQKTKRVIEKFDEKGNLIERITES